MRLQNAKHLPLQLLFVLSPLTTLSAAGWGSGTTFPWSRPARLDQPSPDSITAAADLHAQANDVEIEDYFASARSRLSLMQTSSTCKRLATVKLLSTCENLHLGNAAADLEAIQNLYAAHLAVCELDSGGAATGKIPSACARLELPSSSDGVVEVLDEEGRAKLGRCVAALQGKPQWWTSYSNSRRDAYVWCKVMGPGFDQEEYARSLSEVVAANGEVAKALGEFLRDNQRRMNEQHAFIKDVEALRVKLARDLEVSARDVVNTLKWLQDEAGSDMKEMVMLVSASLGDVRVDAEGLKTLVRSGADDAEGLREVIVSTYRTIYDGIGSVSKAQELQLSRTNEQALKLQEYLEWMVDSRIKAVVGNASEMIVNMSDGLRSTLTSVEHTKQQMQSLETKMSILTAGFPTLSSIVDLLSALKWPAILVIAALAGWRPAVLLAASLVLLKAASSSVPPPPPSFASRIITLYETVLPYRILRPACIFISISIALFWFIRTLTATDLSKTLSPLIRLYHSLAIGRRRADFTDLEAESTHHDHQHRESNAFIDGTYDARSTTLSSSSRLGNNHCTYFITAAEDSDGMASYATAPSRIASSPSPIPTDSTPPFEDAEAAAGTGRSSSPLSSLRSSSPYFVKRESSEEV